MFVGGYQGEHGQEEAAAAAATIKAQPPLLSLQVQGDATVHVYTGKVTFYKVPETHGHV